MAVLNQERRVERLLVVNAGSSSLKLTVLGDGPAPLAATTIERWDGDDDAIGELAQSHGPIDLVGHRVVHGGTEFTEAVRVDDEVLGRLRALTSLAPLHQPRSLAAIDAARRALPAVPQYACFDTAFHTTLPPAAATYALPREWRSRWALRRYGFHGLSHAYAARRAAQIVGRPLASMRVVTCHLGSGASLCAIDGGRSVDTTMGFTPLDGMVMGTRSGALDPGLVLWLMQEGGMSAGAVAEALEHRSGLRGLVGHDDMRDVLAARARGDDEAALAFDVYVHSLRHHLGAMVAVLDALDLLVFTGGVGEHVPEVRTAAGIPIDERANASTTADGELTADDCEVRVAVVTAREDLEIARQLRANPSHSVKADGP